MALTTTPPSLHAMSGVVFPAWKSLHATFFTPLLCGLKTSYNYYIVNNFNNHFSESLIIIIIDWISITMRNGEC
ncbi:hypothetical protein Hanom_Chr04g00289071 [Helianthus anomalus]